MQSRRVPGEIRGGARMLIPFVDQFVKTVQQSEKDHRRLGQGLLTSRSVFLGLMSEIPEMEA
jgi:hypothetical protein